MMLRRFHPHKIGPMLDEASYAALRAQAMELIASGHSPLTLGERLGFNNIAAKGLIYAYRCKQREARVSLPPCRCGRPHNHLGNCVEKRHGCRCGIRPLPDDFASNAPSRSKRGLLRYYRISLATLNRWLSESPGVTTRPVHIPFRDTGSKPSPINDSLYARINSLVPPYFAKDVRADVISEIYLAVLDGSLPIERLLLDGRAIMTRAAGFCGVGSTILSLDVAVGDAYSPMIDFIEDKDAFDAFERIFEEDED